MTIIKTLYAESTVNARKIVCQETTIYGESWYITVWKNNLRM